MLSMVKKNLTTVSQAKKTLEEVGVSLTKCKRNVHNWKYRGFITRCKSPATLKNRRARLDFDSTHSVLEFYIYIFCTGQYFLLSFRRMLQKWSDSPSQSTWIRTQNILKATGELLSAKMWNILQWPSQAVDPNPLLYGLQLPKAKLKAERLTNKQQLKAAALRLWQNISWEETQHLLISMGHRLQAVIACKGFSCKS